MGIKLFGKNIVQMYSHDIMKLDYKVVSRDSNCLAFSIREIDMNKIEYELELIGSTISIPHLKRLVSKNKSLCEGFIFERMGKAIGTIWVMYKGANDLEYKIRNIDAYIFDVYVNESSRGNGYACEMVRYLMEYLHGKGIETAHLAVATTNRSAIRAYEKTGFVTVSKRNFIRLLKVNIPYCIL